MHGIERLRADVSQSPSPLTRSLSQISRIYYGCAEGGQIFRSFSGNVEKDRQPSPRLRQTSQLRSRAFGVLTYSLYALRA